MKVDCYFLLPLRIIVEIKIQYSASASHVFFIRWRGRTRCGTAGGVLSRKVVKGGVIGIPRCVHCDTVILSPYRSEPLCTSVWQETLGSEENGPLHCIETESLGKISRAMFHRDTRSGIQVQDRGALSSMCTHITHAKLPGERHHGRTEPRGQSRSFSKVLGVLAFAIDTTGARLLATP